MFDESLYREISRIWVYPNGFSGDQLFLKRIAKDGVRNLYLPTQHLHIFDALYSTMISRNEGYLAQMSKKYYTRHDAYLYEYILKGHEE